MCVYYTSVPLGSAFYDDIGGLGPYASTLAQGDPLDLE